MPELLEQRASALEEELARRGQAPSAESLDALFAADERLARRELRRQIARLETELSELFISAFPRHGLSFQVQAAGGPRILAAAELEQVRDALLLRIRDVRGLLSDRAYVETKKRELLERMIAEPQLYPWVRISNEDIGEPGCTHWHSRPRFGLIGMLMGWWRVKLSSGCPLPKGRPASRPNKKWLSPASGGNAMGQRPQSGFPSQRARPRSPRRRAGSGVISARQRPGALSRWASWRC